LKRCCEFHGSHESELRPPTILAEERVALLRCRAARPGWVDCRSRRAISWGCFGRYWPAADPHHPAPNDPLRL